MPDQPISKVTIRAVADLAGVSVMSVSNVINGRSVRPKTRDAVLRAVKALNFVPNVAARQLASASVPIIGMLQDAVDHPFASALFLGALKAAARHGAQLLPLPIEYGDAAAGWSAISVLRARGARALLISPSIWFRMSRTGRAFPKDLPVITVAPPSLPNDVASVGIDEAAAARDMTERLIDQGHRRIGFIRAPASSGLREARYQGYQDALAAKGIPEDAALVVDGDMGFESALKAGGSLLDLPQPPTAIFASNDDMAAGVLVAAHIRKLEIPGDVAIAGFDNSILCTRLWPSLTSVHQPIAEMAEFAIERLVEFMQQNRNISDNYYRTTYFRHEIVERDSTRAREPDSAKVL